MLAQLKVTRKSAPDFLVEQIFNLDTIVIGRETDKGLSLPEAPRYVSREHVLINRRGQTFELSDVSKNGAFLNGRKIDNKLTYTLQDGARIEIRDYVIEFRKISPTPAAILESTKTLSLNPFLEDAKNLNDFLLRLHEKYADFDAVRREDYLRNALQSAFGPSGFDGVAHILTEILQGEPLRAAALDQPPRGQTDLLRDIDIAVGGDLEAPPPQRPTKPLSSPPVFDLKDSPSRSIVFSFPEEGEPEPSRPAHGKAAAAPESNLVDRLNDSVDVLLEAAVKMLGAQREFRRTFLEETTYRPKKRKGEALDINFCEQWEELKAYLHEAMISPQDAERRVTQLKKAMESLMYHQQALLAGYRRSMKEGGKKFLEALSPAKIEAEGQAGLLPFLTQAGFWKQYIAKHQQLLQSLSNDFTYVEKTYFNPAFAEGYKRSDFEKA